jgi:hypothetical protein
MNATIAAEAALGSCKLYNNGSGMPRPLQLSR